MAEADRLLRVDVPTCLRGVPRAARRDLLDVLEPLPPEGWERTATVTGMIGELYEYSTLYYGDWMARHERSHLKHIARILKSLSVAA